MNCAHDSRAVCYLCSDQVSWWRDARLSMGLGAEPPNEWKVVRIAIGKNAHGVWERIYKFPAPRDVQKNASR